VIDEHDFYGGKYLDNTDRTPGKPLRAEDQIECLADRRFPDVVAADEQGVPGTRRSPETGRGSLLWLFDELAHILHNDFPRVTPRRTTAKTPASCVNSLTDLPHSHASSLA
jgi:hypothetical protein